MCDVLDKVENRGIAKGKAEGEDVIFSHIIGNIHLFQRRIKIA